VTTGSIAANSAADVTVTWPAAFPNTNYTATVTVQEANNSSLVALRIKSQTASSITVRVENQEGVLGAARTGTLHAIAIAD
jgi:hypothetical protein